MSNAFGALPSAMFGKNGRVFGWPEDAFPAPQGEYYCGVGLEQVYGRCVRKEPSSRPQCGLAVALS